MAGFGKWHRPITLPLLKKWKGQKMPIEKICIRKVQKDEVLALMEISRKTFIESFGPVNTPENMELYLAENLCAGKLSSELANPGSEFHFAMKGEKPIGYLKLNLGEAQTYLKDGAAMEIERIYVEKAYQGTGLGLMLLLKAMEIAKKKMAGFIWLGVWEQNHKAIRFYQKQGFVEFGRHLFKLGNDFQTDLLMRLG